jgi:hypothetical protein
MGGAPHSQRIEAPRRPSVIDMNHSISHPSPLAGLDDPLG